MAAVATVDGSVYVCRIKQQPLWFSVSAAHWLNPQLLWKWVCVVWVSESRSQWRCIFNCFNLMYGGRCRLWLQIDSKKWVIITMFHVFFCLLNSYLKRGPTIMTAPSAEVLIYQSGPQLIDEICFVIKVMLNIRGYWIKGCPGGLAL